MLCWREAGAGGEGRTRSARAVDFKKGTCEDGICHYEQEIAFASKNILLLSKYAPVWIYFISVQNK
jgi:hypothetical protein